MWRFITSSMHAGGRGKKPRSVVLTTHAMEEAEALANRMCIMVAGRIRALGTVQHLKNNFGNIFSLEMRLQRSEADSRAAGVEAFLKTSPFFHGATLVEAKGVILRYTIPREGEVCLPDMFAALETEKERLGIENYALSQATLDQVFIRLASEGEEDKDGN